MVGRLYVCCRCRRRRRRHRRRFFWSLFISSSFISSIMLVFSFVSSQVKIKINTTYISILVAEQEYSTS